MADKHEHDVKKSYRTDKHLICNDCNGILCDVGPSTKDCVCSSKDVPVMTINGTWCCEECKTPLCKHNAIDTMLEKQREREDLDSQNNRVIDIDD